MGERELNACPPSPNFTASSEDRSETFSTHGSPCFETSYFYMKIQLGASLGAQGKAFPLVTQGTRPLWREGEREAGSIPVLIVISQAHEMLWYGVGDSKSNRQCRRKIQNATPLAGGCAFGSAQSVAGALCTC